MKSQRSHAGSLTRWVSWLKFTAPRMTSSKLWPRRKGPRRSMSSWETEFKPPSHATVWPETMQVLATTTRLAKSTRSF